MFITSNSLDRIAAEGLSCYRQSTPHKTSLVLNDVNHKARRGLHAWVPVIQNQLKGRNSTRCARTEATQSSCSLRPHSRSESFNALVSAGTTSLAASIQPRSSLPALIRSAALPVSSSAINRAGPAWAYFHLDLAATLPVPPVIMEKGFPVKLSALGACQEHPCCSF